MVRYFHCWPNRYIQDFNLPMQQIDNYLFFYFSVFMSENGWDCVQDHREDIIKCVNSSVPELFDGENIKQKYSNIHFMIYSPENCQRGEAIRVCVENSLLKCKDPTPSNVVNSLLLSMQKATPCKDKYDF